MILRKKEGINEKEGNEGIIQTETLFRVLCDANPEFLKQHLCLEDLNIYQTTRK